MVLHGFRSDPIISMLRNRVGLMALIAGLCLVCALPGATQTDANPAEPQPQIQVLVLQIDQSGTANVAVTYPGKEPLDIAQKDIVEIGARTGWQISNPIMTDNLPSTPERPPMTSVEFTVSNALPEPSSLQAGGFPIEPLIIALKRFHDMELVFAARPDFRFKGLTKYEDDYVRIRLRPGGGQTYTYRVEIKRSDFDSLNLPVVVEPVVAPPARTPTSILVPIVISVCVGLGVLLLAYLSKHRNRP